MAWPYVTYCGVTYGHGHTLHNPPFEVGYVTHGHCHASQSVLLEERGGQIFGYVTYGIFPYATYLLWDHYK